MAAEGRHLLFPTLRSKAEDTLQLDLHVSRTAHACLHLHFAPWPCILSSSPCVFTLALPCLGLTTPRLPSLLSHGDRLGLQLTAMVSTRPCLVPSTDAHMHMPPCRTSCAGRLGSKSDGLHSGSKSSSQAAVQRCRGVPARNLRYIGICLVRSLWTCAVSFVVDSCM